MSCPQRLLGDYFAAFARPDPDAPLPVNQLWVGEIADYMTSQVTVHHRQLTVEDAMDELKLRADGPDVAPAVATVLRLRRSLYIVRYVPSRRPSRKGAPVALWGSKA